MSFINFTLTHRFTAGAPSAVPRESSIGAGFSREGGRLEYVTRTFTPGGSVFPVERDVALTPDITKAGAGLLDAVQGAGWLERLEVVHGDGGQSDLVNWTYRSGLTDQGRTGNLPAKVQAVLDAARLLERTTLVPA